MQYEEYSMRFRAALNDSFKIHMVPFLKLTHSERFRRMDAKLNIIIKLDSPTII